MLDAERGQYLEPKYSHGELRSERHPVQAEFMLESLALAGGIRRTRSAMSNSPEVFDAIAIVVDWLDACGQRRLLDLLELYDDDATVDCGEGGPVRRTARVAGLLDPEAAGSGSRRLRHRGGYSGNGRRLSRVPRLRRPGLPDAIPLRRRREERSHDLRSVGGQRRRVDGLRPRCLGRLPHP